MFSYFWCQASPVSPRAPDPVRIWTDPGWFSKSSTSMVRLTSKVWKQKRMLLIYLKYSFHRLLKISLRLQYRTPDPVFLAKTGSSSLLLFEIFFDGLFNFMYLKMAWRMNTFTSKLCLNRWTWITWLSNTEALDPWYLTP